MTSASDRGRNNKERSKADERRVMRRLGGKRFPADTGGLLDGIAPFCHGELAVQCKGGKQPAAAIRTGLAAAREGASAAQLPAAVITDRSQGRARILEYVVIELGDFCRWFHLGERIGE